MKDSKVKKRDKFSKLKEILKFILNGHKCRTTNSMATISNTFDETSIANYLTPLIKTDIIKKEDTGSYGLNKFLINQDCFHDIKHVSNFISSTLCQMEIDDSKEAFQYFFIETPKKISKLIIYKSSTDLKNTDLINCLLSNEKYQIFHKMHEADFGTKLVIEYEHTKENIRNKKIIPLKSFIIIDILYLCFYDLFTNNIDILGYDSITSYEIDNSEIPYFEINEEKISKTISNFIEKNINTIQSISFAAFPELLITFSKLNLINYFEDIEVPNKKDFKKEALEEKKSSSICKFEDTQSKNICHVNGSLKPSIFDTIDQKFTQFIKFSNKKEKKSFQIYAPKVNLIYIIRNYYEYMELIDYSNVQEEVKSFISAILEREKDYR